MNVYDEPPMPGVTQSRPRGGMTPVGMVVTAIILLMLSIVPLALIARMPTADPSAAGDNGMLLVVLGTVSAGVLGSVGLAMLIIGSVRWAFYGYDGKGHRTDPKVIELLGEISRHVLLSDTAKLITHRHNDLLSLRKTIEQDIRAGQYDAAMVLVEEMAKRYGHLEETESLRRQVTDSRRGVVEAQIIEAIHEIEGIMMAHDFDHAGRETDRLQRKHPHSEQLRQLPQRIAQEKENYKHQLERDFLEAKEREDVARGMEVLRELDRYLTPEEAEPFREIARDLIGKARDNLGLRFKLAYKDGEWVTALRVGEQLIEEFPNTKMADEVRGMLFQLRERAAKQQTVRR